MRGILATRGPLGFWHGVDAMMIGNVPYSVVFYSCYQPIRNAVNGIAEVACRKLSFPSDGESRPKTSGWAVDADISGQMVAGGLSDIIGMTVFMPGELVRMRMMSDPARFHHPLSAQFHSECIAVSSARVSSAQVASALAVTIIRTTRSDSFFQVSQLFARCAGHCPS